MFIGLVLIALALLTGQTLLVILARLLRPRSNVYATIILVSVLTAPLTLIFSERLVGLPVNSAGRLFLVVTHLTLGGFLFHFMTLPDRSVTLRVFVELLLAPGGTLTSSGLRERYSVRSMVSSRLEQMASAGFITISAAGRIAVVGKGIWFGQFVTGGRRLFRITSAN